VLNQRVARIAPRFAPSNKPWFEYSALLVTDVYSQVVNIGGGSAQPNISSTQIEDCRLIVPSADLIPYFNNTVDPFMQKWMLNSRQALSLSAIRDTLLPKLLSGEIRIKDAEKVVGAVA
jgi:type I restriction enzyme S subunit